MTPKKRLLVAAMLLGLLILFILIISIGSKSRGLTVNLKTVPNDSVITLDGKKVSAGEHTLSTGKHTIVASLKSFDNDTCTISSTDLSSGQTIYLVPEATSSESLDWLSKNPSVQQEREKIGGIKASIAQENLKENFPVISTLPYGTLEYRIDYSDTTSANKSGCYLTDGNTVDFIVRLYPPLAVGDPTTKEYQDWWNTNKNLALQYLKNNGVDLTKVKVDFVNVYSTN